MISPEKDERNVGNRTNRDERMCQILNINLKLIPKAKVINRDHY